MKNIPILLFVSFSLISCATYKVETSENFDFSKLSGKNDDGIQTKKINDYTQGFQCFEPMMFVLTIGLFPTHCVDDYKVTVNDQTVGDAKVTVMSGWIPLFMSVLPGWKYGSEPNLPEELVKMAKRGK